MKLRTALTIAVLASASAAQLPATAQTITSQVEMQGDSFFVQITKLQARERNGFLTVQFEAANSDIDPRRIFWRIKWLDEAGFQAADDEAWKPALIQGGASQNLQGQAPTPKAKDFRLQFNAELPR